MSGGGVWRITKSWGAFSSAEVDRNTRKSGIPFSFTIPATWSPGRLHRIRAAGNGPLHRPAGGSGDRRDPACDRPKVDMGNLRSPRISPAFPSLGSRGSGREGCPGASPDPEIWGRAASWASPEGSGPEASASFRLHRAARQDAPFRSEVPFSPQNRYEDPEASRRVGMDRTSLLGLWGGSRTLPGREHILMSNLMASPGEWRDWTFHLVRGHPDPPFSRWSWTWNRSSPRRTASGWQ